jgi:RNA polymerase sigma-70 factor, ECF subfamily
MRGDGMKDGQNLGGASAMDGDHLDRFRGYLRFLAEVNLDPRFQGKLDPSDIVQETLLKACQGLEGLRGNDDRQVAAWLRTILARQIANASRDLQCPKGDVRKEKSLEQALAESSIRLLDFLNKGDSSPSGKMEKSEAVLGLADAMAHLPLDQRQALILKHWRGWSLDEIAAHMGRTRPGVAGLLRRALESLRRKLKGLDG